MLVRRPADLSAEATVVEGVSGVALFGPAASTAITVVAAKGADGLLRLAAAPR